MDGDGPLVPLVALPDHHHQAAAGRSARPILANAATGSSKNIVPNLLMARSKRCCGKWWTCASACSKVTLRARRRGSARGHARWRARRRRPRVQCLPGPCAPPVAGRLPRPTSDVEDVVVELDGTGATKYLVVPSQLGVVAARAGRRFADRVLHPGSFPTLGRLCAAANRRPPRWHSATQSLGLEPGDATMLTAGEPHDPHRREHPDPPGGGRPRLHRRTRAAGREPLAARRCLQRGPGVICLQLRRGSARRDHRGRRRSNRRIGGCPRHPGAGSGSRQRLRGPVPQPCREGPPGRRPARSHRQGGRRRATRWTSAISAACVMSPWTMALAPSGGRGESQAFSAAITRFGGEQRERAHLRSPGRGARRPWERSSWPACQAAGDLAGHRTLLGGRRVRRPGCR